MSDKKKRKLSEDYFYDLIENEIDYLMKFDSNKDLPVVILPYSLSYQLQIQRNTKKFCFQINKLGIKYMKDAVNLGFIIYVKNLQVDKDPNLDINMDELKILLTFHSAKNNDIFKGSRKFQQTKINIKQGFEMYMVNQYYTFSQPILYLKFLQFEASAFEFTKKLNFNYEVFLKAHNSTVFENLFDKIQGNLTIVKQDQNTCLDLKISVLNFNYKLSLLKSLLKIKEMLQKENQFTFRFFKIIVYNNLQQEFKVIFQNNIYEIDEPLKEIHIKDNQLKIDWTMDLLQFFEINPLKSVEDYFNEIQKHVQFPKDINHKGQYKRLQSFDLSTLNKTQMRVSIGDRDIDINLYKENQEKIPLYKSLYFIKIQNSFYNGYHHVSINSNINFVNNTDQFVILNLYQKEQDEENQEFQSFEVFNTKKLMIDENYCIPFIENIENMFFKISFEVEKNTYNIFNFVRFMDQKQFAFEIKNNQNIQNYLFVQQHKDEEENNYQINIGSPLFIKNNLPFKIKLLFAKQQKLQNNQVQSFQINLNQFEEKQYYQFLPKQYPFVYVNQISDEQDFFNIQQKFDNKQQNEERFIFQCQPFGIGSNLINILVYIKTNFDRVQIELSAEYLLINETNAVFQGQIEEKNYLYDEMSFNSMKFDVELKKIKQNETKQINSSFSLCHSAHLQDNFEPLEKNNSKFFQYFSGDYNYHKKLIHLFDSKKQQSSIELNDENQQVQIINIQKQYIQMSQIQTRNDITKLIIFHYPFYIINQTNYDLVIQLNKISQSLTILTQKQYFSSNQILKQFIGINDKLQLQMKVNQNDYNWSEVFSFNFQNLFEGKKYLQIRPNQKDCQNLNLKIFVETDSVSKIIKIQQNKQPAIQIKNNTNSTLFASQKVNDKNKEILISKVQIEFFWNNSFENQDITIFKKDQDNYIALASFNFEDKYTGNQTFQIDDWELGILQIAVSEEKDFYQIVIDKFMRDQKKSSYKSRLKNMINKASKFQSFSLYQQFNLKQTSKSTQQYIQTTDLKLKIDNFLISFNNEKPQEVLLALFQGINFSYNKQMEYKREQNQYFLKIKYIQLDSQIDSQNHNVLQKEFNSPRNNQRPRVLSQFESFQRRYR